MFELTILCAESQTDILTDALLELAALSVFLTDAHEDTAAEQPIFSEPGLEPEKLWAEAKIAALFATKQQAEQVWQELLAAKLVAPQDLVAIVEVPQQDWVKITQAQFKPTAISDDFWIVPSWAEKPAAAKVVIELDPGMAFGTGTHATTKMCLRRLASQVKAGDAVLDYGCGSGILAIAAAKHGAAKVVAVDIDTAALEAAADNARKNTVEIQVGAPDSVNEQFDIVVANILAQPLKVLAPLLTARLAAGGTLILAGVLERQEQELKQAYQQFLPLQVADSEDGWILLVGQKY